MTADAGGTYCKKKKTFWASDNREMMLNGQQSVQRGKVRANLEVLKRDNRQVYLISKKSGVDKYFPRKENIRPTEKEEKQVNTVYEPTDFPKITHKKKIPP